MASVRDGTLPSIEEQEKFWDWHWQNEAERRTKNNWKDRRHARMIEYIRATGIKSPRMLDIGCGSGWYTGDLAQIGPTTGIDLSPVAIEVAKKRFPEVDFRAGDLYALNMPEKSFDIILAQEVFDHVGNQPEFVKIVAAHLADGGYFIVSCTNRYVYDRRGADTFPEQPNQHIEKSLSMRQFKTIIGESFDVLQSCSMIPLGNEGFLRVVNSAKLNSFAGKIFGDSAVLHAKERVGFGYQNLLLARKKQH